MDWVNAKECVKYHSDKLCILSGVDQYEDVIIWSLLPALVLLCVTGGWGIARAEARNT